MKLVRKMIERGPYGVMRAAAAKVLAIDSSLILVKNVDGQRDPLEPKIEVRFDWCSTEEVSALMRKVFDWQDVDDFAARGSRALGTYDGDTLAAYVWVHYNRFYFPFFDYTLVCDQGEAYLGPAFTAPKYRGKGLYGALMSRMFAYLRDEGYHLAYGNVSVKNIPSIKWLRNSGYEPIRKITVARVFSRFIIYKSVKPCSTYPGVPS